MYTASPKSAEQPQTNTCHAPPPAEGVTSERKAITAQTLDKDQVKTERNSDKTNRRKPAKLTIDTENVLPADPFAEDTKSERLVGSSFRQPGLPSDSSDEEQPILNQKASMKVSIRYHHSDSCFQPEPTKSNPSERTTLACTLFRSLS